MNRGFEHNNIPADRWQLRRNGCDWASAVTALCRGTGLTQAACYRVLLTVMDASAGRPTFPMSFVQFGKRMARGKRKSDPAYNEMTSRDVAILEKSQAGTGFYLVRVTRGDKKRKRVSQWEFPGLEWIEQIHSRAVEILNRERRKSRNQKMNREACFDAAFDEIAKSIPREQPRNGNQRLPVDRLTRSLNLVKSIGGIAKRLRLNALDDGANEKELTSLQQAIIRQVDRAFSLPVDMIRVKPNEIPVASHPPTPPPPSVVRKGGTSEERLVTMEVSREGGKTVGIDNAHPCGGEALGDPQTHCLTADPSFGRVALDYLISVGVNEFAVLFLDDTAPKEEAVKDRIPDLNAGTLKEMLPELMERASRTNLSFVVDMRSVGARLVQVDECTEDVLRLLAPVSVFQLLTSDGNGQSILALPSELSTEDCNSIKARLFAFLKQHGANRGASGASRWPGSFNFKPNRRRADGSFPMVRLLGGLFGRTVTIKELEDRGLLAPTETTAAIPPKARLLQRLDGTSWPEYDTALSATDRSAADYKFCIGAAEIGHPSDAIKHQLIELSTKARERGDEYAERTIEHALEVVRGRDLAA